MDVTMSWLSLFCFGYTYYELCTTIKLDISFRIRIRMRMGLTLEADGPRFGGGWASLWRRMGLALEADIPTDISTDRPTEEARSSSKMGGDKSI